MTEERKIVLDLLEKGTITKDEAFKLLEALDKVKDEEFDMNLELKRLRNSADKLLVKAKAKLKDAEPKIYSGADLVKSKVKEFSKTVTNSTVYKTKDSDIFEHDDFLNK